MAVAIEDVVAMIEALAPKELAFEWDNTGLAVRCSDTVSTLLIALDATNEVIDEAVEIGADMILSHHPLLMPPIESLSAKKYVESLVMRLVKNGISLYCAHTSYDKAAGGINDILAAKLRLKDVTVVGGDGEDLMRVGKMSVPCIASELFDYVKQALGVSRLKVSDVSVGQIRKVAVVGGSGGDLVQAAKNAGAQALITGEAKHSHHLVAKGIGVMLIEAGHFETEQFFVEEIFCGLQARANEVQLHLGLKKAKSVGAPYKII